jgi:RNA polymerase sigma-70 factor, ECF subfamily
VSGRPASDIAGLVRRARSSGVALHERHAAFSTLVERFEEMALSTAFRACGDVELARDACQEAFVVAWRTLSTLRDPEAFGGWLKCLVRTHGVRVRRKQTAVPDIDEGPPPANDSELLRRETERQIRSAVAQLPANEREAVLLVYFLGESLEVLARVQGISVGNAGKRIYSARLRLRQSLPRDVTRTLLDDAPMPAFAQRVAAGLLDELVGEYRFPERPAHRVVLRREGSLLVSYAAGQRHVLAGRKTDSLVATEYDGEARFRRDRQGRVSHFVYYEFGRRMGVARKLFSA